MTTLFSSHEIGKFSIASSGFGGILSLFALILRRHSLLCVAKLMCIGMVSTMVWIEAIASQLPDHCLQCHDHRQSRHSCVGCHQQMIEAVDSRQAIHLSEGSQLLVRKTYLKAPDLGAKVSLANGHDVSRYRRDGLIQFLESPVPRFPKRQQSMYPLSERALAELSDYINQSEIAEPISEHEQSRRAAKGAELFQASGCHHCHHREQDQAPLLRIGRPLLSKAYFAAKVAGSVPIVDGLMPKFAMSDEEISALYTYVSTDQSDLDVGGHSQQSPYAKVVLGRELYQELMTKVFSKSCKHCHSSDRNSQQTIAATFPGLDGSGFLINRRPNGTLGLEQSSPDIFANQQGCRDSILVNRLARRRKEWHGGLITPMPGMPLTLAPLPDIWIAKVKLWSAMGCPTDIGSICTVCLATAYK